MSEGKLKEIFLYLQEHKVASSPQWIAITPDTLMEASKILDEAKKEFPKPDEGWADGWVGEDFDGDVLAWFKKWFGEADTK